MALTDVDGTLAAAGIAIDAPGLACAGEALGRVIDLKTPAVQLLHDTLANSGLSVTNHIRLTHSASSSEAVRITVPAPTSGFNTLLLVHDSTGAISWHAPEGLEPTSEFVKQPVFVEAPTTAAAAMSGRRVSFEVPQGRFTADAQHPGFLSRVTGLVEHFRFRPTVTGLTKVLTVVEYPVEHLVGEAGFKLFKRWEDNKHPYVLRWFPARGGLTAGEPLSPTNWHELAEGPTLLFIHGIFSNCDSGFSGLIKDEQTWTELRARYQNRIIGFDHPTASVSPADNAKWFLGQLPRVSLDLDIICHSRGGLVARSIADRAAQLTEPEGPKVKVDRIVFAATPNGGSQITVTGNWVAMINRMSSVLTLPAKFLPAPVDAISAFLAAGLEVLKLVAVGVALKLPGLEDMAPNSPFLQALSKSTNTASKYFAAAADFEPGPVLANIFKGKDDAGDIVDPEIFAGVHNDIAVPTNGVWDPANPDGRTPAPQAVAIPGFPITDPWRRLDIGPGSVVWHCEYFDDADMRARLLEWLPVR